MSSIRQIAVETKGIGERDSLEPKLIELSEKLDYFNYFVWIITFWYHFLRWDNLLRQWVRQRKEIIWNTLCVKCVSGRLSGAEKKGPGFWKLFTYTYFTQPQEWVRLNKRKKKLVRRIAKEMDCERGKEGFVRRSCSYQMRCLIIFILIIRP